MAGDWIKMRGNLWDDPRISKLVDLTDSSEAAVIGGLYWLWATADQHTEDGIMPGLTLRQIDRKTGVQGIGEALIAIGWLADDPEGVRIVNFEEHNGSSAKKRCQTAKRVVNHRAGNANETHAALQNERTSVNTALTREEKRREEIKEENKLTLVPGNSVPGESPPDSIKKKKSIPCPHLKVLSLWAEVMPELAQPNADLWVGQRADHLRARWRSLGTLNEWATEDEGLADFEGAFRLARESDFLMGRTQRKDGKPPFSLTLDWLVCPNNWTKFLERKYHKARAA